MKIQKPTIPQIPIAAWGEIDFSKFICQEKSDGRHEFARIGDGLFNCERMKDNSLVVNDVVEFYGEDIREFNTGHRWRACSEYFDPLRTHRHGIRLCRILDGLEGVQGEIASGFEGAVIKGLDSPFACNWFKLKKSENFIVKVTALNGGKNSVQIADSVTGKNRGSIPLRGGKVDKVRVGSILKVNAFGAHPSGLLREAKPDDDSENSWLISY
jgi:hypothetical protein